MTPKPDPAALTPEQAPEWRCFHCDEIFTDVDEARLHFGDSLQGDPICRLNAMEGGLVKLVRDQENELHQFRTEDTANNRVFYALGAEHSVALRREEEKGYARGLADGRDIQKYDRESLIAALAELEPGLMVCEWKPIESAPKDGTCVIVGVYGMPGTGEAHYEEDHGWYWANNHSSDSWGGEIYPTHWMPLPAEPAKEDTKP